MKYSPNRSFSRLELTRAQAVEGAANNLLPLLSDPAFVSFVAQFIWDTGEGPRNVAPPIRAAAELRKAAIRRPFKNAASIPHDEASIHACLSTLAVPSDDADVYGCIVEIWLHDRLKHHVQALETLRRKHPAVFRAMFVQDLRTAARHGTKAGMARGLLTRLLADQARFRLIGLAHDTIAHIRRLATNPHGSYFCGFKQWKFAGHVLLSTVAGPALVTQGVIAAAKEISGDDDVAVDYLTGRFLPANHLGRTIIDLAFKVRLLLGTWGVPPDRLDARMGQIMIAIEAAAGLTSVDVARCDLARSAMTNLWFGLEPAEAATYVAFDLVRALNAIDACVEAAIDGRRMPTALAEPAKAHVITAATLLRYEGRPDRQSLQLGADRGRGGGIDQANKGSRLPFVSLMAKLRDRDVAAATSRTFGIDRSLVFGR